MASTTCAGDGPQNQEISWFKPVDGQPNFRVQATNCNQQKLRSNPTTCCIYCLYFFFLLSLSKKVVDDSIFNSWVSQQKVERKEKLKIERREKHIVCVQDKVFHLITQKNTAKYTHTLYYGKEILFIRKIHSRGSKIISWISDCFPPSATRERCTIRRNEKLLHWKFILFFCRISHTHTHEISSKMHILSRDADDSMINWISCHLLVSQSKLSTMIFRECDFNYLECRFPNERQADRIQIKSKECSMLVEWLCQFILTEVFEDKQGEHFSLF